MRTGRTRLAWRTSGTDFTLRTRGTRFTWYPSRTDFTLRTVSAWLPWRTSGTDFALRTRGTRFALRTVSARCPSRTDCALCTFRAWFTLRTGGTGFTRCAGGAFRSRLIPTYLGFPLRTRRNWGIANRDLDDDVMIS